MEPDTSPVFQQLADTIAEGILAGSYPEGSAIPSLNELSVFFTVNPITASRGVNVLVEQELVHKRRGVGMFVTEGARQRLLDRRRAEFRGRYVAPLLREARLLGLTDDELKHLIDEESRP